VSRRIRSLLAALAASLIAAVSFTVATAAPAAAFGAETFGCRVSPGVILTWQPVCTNSRPATTYNAGFAVLNTSGTYDFSWRIDGPYTSIFTGCDRTSNGCAVLVPGGSTDSVITVTVTYTQNGLSATRSATAIINGYCGGQLC
jgi:hypothetical protein